VLRGVKKKKVFRLGEKEGRIRKLRLRIRLAGGSPQDRGEVAWLGLVATFEEGSLTEFKLPLSASAWTDRGRDFAKSMSRGESRKTTRVPTKAGPAAGTGS